MAKTFTERLTDHLRQVGASPFLFVGSGLSRRYLGLDSWEGLLQRFAGKTDRPYEFYRSTADGQFPRIGSAIANEFHGVWWDKEDYASSRAKYMDDAVGKDSAIKIEIADYLRSAALEEVGGDDARRELELLRTAVVDGVITTNYDLFLESVFDGFEVFVGQDELLFSQSHGVGEIYKIHGCATRPNSIVLTQEDYDRFDARNPYLAAKLLTVFVEHPVVFLGYSLTDKNITAILSSIAKCLTDSNIGQLRDRLIFVQWDASADSPSMDNSSIVVDGLPLPVVLIKAASFEPVFEALASVPRSFPARVLRRLKEHVYELVKSNDPKQRLYVRDLEDAEGDAAELDVVFGVGAIDEVKSVGYRGLGRDDLIHDVLHEDRGYDAGEVVRDVLPRLVNHGKYLPLFRYLRLAGLLADDGVLVSEHGLPTKVKRRAICTLDYFQPPQWYQKKRDSVESKYNSFADVVSDKTPSDVVMYAPLLEATKLQPEPIRRFLIDNEQLLSQGNDLVKTQYIKMVCIFDWLKNRLA